MIKIKTIIFVVFFTLLNTYAYSYIIIATETTRGEYENSKFIKQNNGEFKYRIEIDEEKGIAQITEYTRLKDNSIVDWKSSYVISYIDDGNSLSGSTLMVDKNKSNQKMICLVGNPGTLATEIILIGETFFEYAKASSGRLYMASGTIQKVISATKDIENQFKK